MERRFDMKTLQDYIKESILDDEDVLVADTKKTVNNPYKWIKNLLFGAKDVSDLPDEFIPFIGEHVISRLKQIPFLKNKKINAGVNYGYKNLRVDIEASVRGNSHLQILSIICTSEGKLEVQLPIVSNKQLEKLNLYPDLFALLEELKTEYGFQEPTKKGTFAQKFKQYSAEL
jgi:hypothetical protein